MVRQLLQALLSLPLTDPCILTILNIANGCTARRPSEQATSPDLLTPYHRSHPLSPHHV